MARRISQVAEEVLIDVAGTRRISQVAEEVFIAQTDGTRRISQVALEAFVRDPQPPLPPTLLTAIETGPTTIDLDWIDTTTETGYRVERSLTPFAASYANLTGASGISTPDHADLDIVGDLDVRMCIAMADWSDTVNLRRLIGKRAGGSDRAWSFYIDASGELGLNWSVDGGSGTGGFQESSVNLSATPDLGHLWIRCTFDVDNGAAGYSIRFYTSSDPIDTDPALVTWVQLGATRTASPATSIFSGTAPLVIGHVDNAAYLIGRVFYAEVRNGIGGTIVANPDFRDSDQISITNNGFTDTTGKVWRIATPASWVTPAGTDVSGPLAANAVSFTDTGLTASTLYYYRVVAFNLDGDSGPSNTASATTDPPPPNAPGSPAAVATGTTSIDVSWTDVAGETGYRVERSLTGVGGWADVSGPLAANTITYTDPGLTPATQYFYRIFAFSGSGDSAASATVDATTDAPPPVGGGNRMGGAGAIRKPPRN